MSDGWWTLLMLTYYPGPRRTKEYIMETISSGSKSNELGARSPPIRGLVESQARPKYFGKLSFSTELTGGGSTNTAWNYNKSTGKAMQERFWLWNTCLLKTRYLQWYDRGCTIYGWRYTGRGDNNLDRKRPRREYSQSEDYSRRLALLLLLGLGKQMWRHNESYKKRGII